MKSRPFLATTAGVAIFVTALGSPIEAASVLTIQERDAWQKSHAVHPSSSSVDWDSSLLVEIDKNAVRDHAARVTDYKLPWSQKEIESTFAILSKRNELLEMAGSKFGDTPEARRAYLAQFSGAMAEILGLIQRDARLRDEANAIYRKHLSGDSPDQQAMYGEILDLVARDLERFRGKLADSLGDARVYFRLGGWHRTGSGSKPIHVPNFDRLDEGDFYVEPRWTPSLSENDKKELDRYDSISNSYNKHGLAGIVSMQKVVGDIESLVGAKAILSCWQGLTELPPGLQSLEEKPPVLKVRETFGDLKEKLSELSRIAASAVGSQSKGADGMVVLVRFSESLSSVHAGLKLASKDISSLRLQAKIAVRSLAEDARAEATAYQGRTDQCVSLTTSGAVALGGLVDSIAQIGGASNLDRAVLEFGEEVSSFLIDDIPQSTEIDLRNIGRREDGDELILKAILEFKKGEDQPPTKKREIEQYRIPIYRVLPYADMSVGMIFADPRTNSSITIPRQFQAAPAYSLLVKWGSRKSVVYNQIFRFGLGVNISALDFNQDEVKEVGLAVAGSVFRDFLQVGYGRNMGLDEWYGFFGIRLPYATFSIPGAMKARGE